MSIISIIFCLGLWVPGGRSPRRGAHFASLLPWDFQRRTRLDEPRGQRLTRKIATRRHPQPRVRLLFPGARPPLRPHSSSSGWPSGHHCHRHRHHRHLLHGSGNCERLSRRRRSSATPHWRSLRTGGAPQCLIQGCSLRRPFVKAF